jgi:hypothetical protein
MIVAAMEEGREVRSRFTDDLTGIYRHSTEAFTASVR